MGSIPLQVRYLETYCIRDGNHGTWTNLWCWCTHALWYYCLSRSRLLIVDSFIFIKRRCRGTQSSVSSVPSLILPPSSVPRLTLGQGNTNYHWRRRQMGPTHNSHRRVGHNGALAHHPRRP